MTRKEIENLSVVEPYCFETDREKRWYELGCIDGLKAADAEPNFEKLWHDISEEPQIEEKEIIFLNKQDIIYISEKFYIPIISHFFSLYLFCMSESRQY